jgi:hypothetical protein
MVFFFNIKIWDRDNPIKDKSNVEGPVTQVTRPK